MSDAVVERGHLRPTRMLIALSVMLLVGLVILALGVTHGAGRETAKWVAALAIGIVVVSGFATMFVYHVAAGRGLWYAPGVRTSVRIDGPGCYRIGTVATTARMGVEVRLVREPRAPNVYDVRILLKAPSGERRWLSDELVPPGRRRRPEYVTIMPGETLEGAELCAIVAESQTDVRATLGVHVYNVLSLMKGRTIVHGGYEGSGSGGFAGA